MLYQRGTTSPAKGKSGSGLVSFFRIIHATTLQNWRLGLPKEIVREFGDDLGDVALLKVPSGKMWSVELSKSEGGIYFRNGWHAFTEHYSIDVGHFLVFRYEGSSQFYVYIFDMSGCEIAYKLDKSEEYNHAAGPSVLPQEENASQNERDTHYNALQAAKSLSLSNPSFRVKMHQSYKFYLPIPAEFAKRYLKDMIGFLTLVSSDGRTWLVEYRGEPKGYFWKILKGWSAFRADMNLKEGNAFVFELIKTEGIVLKVHMFQDV